MAKRKKTKKTKKERVFRQPYDTKLSIECDACGDKMLYRKGRVFSQNIYYTICNKCGNYNTISHDEYISKIRKATEQGE